MKKFKLSAICVVMAAMAMTLALGSCKKEAPNAMLDPQKPTPQKFDPTQIEDMNAYLANFKQRMKSTERGEDETLSLEEAAWHLSSVANYDFANANVEFNDIRFDTLYSNVAITNGAILLSDLGAAYERISTDIDKFYHSLSLDEKHFRFIDASISEKGAVTISLMTTFIHSSKYLGDTLWYYPDMWELNLDCYNFFDGYTELPSSTTGRRELERFLNWKESHNIYGNGSYYYTVTYRENFYYRDEIDPFGSPNYLNSRLYACMGNFDVDILPYICYLCDSFLGLGFEHCPAGLYIINWKVIYSLENPFDHEHHGKEHYTLLVKYGERHKHTPSPGGGGI